MATAKKAAKAPSPARKAPARQSAARPAPAAPARAAAPKAAAAPKPPVPAKAAKPPKADKPKKPKLVRDSFTIPKAEYTVLDALKDRAAKAGSPAKKSEILRAGIKALAALDDAQLKAALAAVPAIKTGRPKKD